MKENKITKKMIIAPIVILSLIVVLLVATKIYEKTKKEEVPKGATITYTSISQAEKKLNAKIPVLESISKKKYTIESYGQGWPWHVDIVYNEEARLEMAKKTSNLLLIAKDTLGSTRETKDVGYISVEYISENEDAPFKRATWRYNNISYVFQLSTSSEMNIEECVNEIINQILLKTNSDIENATIVTDTVEEPVETEPTE